MKVRSACLDPANYKNTWFKLWDEKKKKGMWVADFDTYTEGSNSANGNYKIYSLEITEDYDSAIWAQINDDDKLVPQASPNMFIDFKVNIALIKFDNNAKPDFLDDENKLSMKVELINGFLYVKDERNFIYTRGSNIGRSKKSKLYGLRFVIENVYTVRILNPEGYDEKRVIWPLNCNKTVPYREFN